MASLQTTKIIKRVKRQNLVLWLTPFLPIVLAAFLQNRDVSSSIVCGLYALAFLCAYFTRNLVAWRLSMVVRRPFYYDLDLEEYRERLMLLKWDSVSPFDMITDARAGNDHQQVLNVAHATLAQTKNKLMKFALLTWICSSQFILGDREALRITLGEIDALCAKSRRVARAVEKHTLTCFYRHFINGELELCEADHQRASNDNKKTEESRLHWEFLLAAVYAERRDKERAEQALNAILAREKTLPVFEEVAKAQLLATSEGKGYVGLALRLLPDPNAAETYKPAKTMRRARFGDVLIRVAFVFFAVLAILAPIQETREWEKLSAEVAANVAQVMPAEEAELLAKFYVTLGDDTIIDDICVLRLANGKLLVGSHYCHSGDNDTTYFEPYYIDVREDVPFQHVANFDKAYTVTYRLYRDKNAIPEDALHTEKFKLDGETLYFCVTGIEKQ